MKKQQKSAGEFWREYEEKTGEKVLARSIGQYVSGWEEFDRQGWNSIWGLLIATSGGFRFHHFAQQNWLNALLNFGSGGEGPKEKTLFLPGEQIISVELRKETKWWKKIFSPSVPELIIRYRDSAGAEQTMCLQAEYQSDDFPRSLMQKSPDNGPAAAGIADN
ncbi:MAG: hypothetical protein LBD48_00595 [Treponema sp.]|jgi:hypothetical protein|nr:hypothetical protein [Treponema sp.]